MKATRYTELGVSFEGKPLLAMPDDKMLERLFPCLESAMKRGWPILEPQPKHNNDISIVAGGPNLIDAFDKYEHKLIMCVNQSHDWLLERGIVPDICVFLDNGPNMVDIITVPHKDVKYYCASMTSPELLDKLEGYDTHLWHCLQGVGEDKILPKDANYVSGGNTVGLRAISLAYYLGYRNIQGFGLCGCVLDGKFYVYEDQTTGNEYTTIHNLTFRGNTFHGTKEHAQQAAAFWKVLNYHYDAAITVHGRGLIPKMAEAFWNERMVNHHKKKREQMIQQTIEISKPPTITIPTQVGIEITKTKDKKLEAIVAQAKGLIND